VHSYSKNKHLLARLEPLLHLRPVVLPERQDEERVLRSLRFRLTNEQRAALVADYEAGVPTTELTTRYGLAKGTVLRLLEEAGIAMRRQGLSKGVAEQARLLYESGLSVAAVGERLGQAPTSMARALRRLGSHADFRRRLHEPDSLVKQLEQSSTLSGGNCFSASRRSRSRCAAALAARQSGQMQPAPTRESEPCAALTPRGRFGASARCLTASSSASVHGAGPSRPIRRQ
jgi:hypothetical protein